jgi:hypothetical protein
MVRVRQLAVDEHFSLRGKTLEECIRADKEKGLIPFLVCCFLLLLLLLLNYLKIRFRVR